MAPQWSRCWRGFGKLVWIGAALALLFLTGTQTAFGQHNLETDTDPGVSPYEAGDLKHEPNKALRYSSCGPVIHQYEVQKGSIMKKVWFLLIWLLTSALYLGNETINIKLKPCMDEQSRFRSLFNAFSFSFRVEQQEYDPKDTNKNSFVVSAPNSGLLLLSK